MARGGNNFVFQPDLTVAIERARQINTRFAPARFQAMLLAAHKDMAQVAQASVVNSLKESIENREGGMRPQRETHYLLNALADPKMIDYTIDKFVVGTSFLDESPARPYYRNLEEGTSKFMGRTVLATFMDNNFRNRSGPVPGNQRLDVRMIQYPVHYLHRGFKPSTSGPFLFRITRPIAPRHYFRTGIDRFTKSGFTAMRYEQLKNELLA